MPNNKYSKTWKTYHPLPALTYTEAIQALITFILLTICLAIWAITI